MISLPNPKTKMTLTQAQYDQLLSNYAEEIVEGMDLDSLVQFAVEQIEENLRANCSNDNELIEEIGRFYDEEYLAGMLESVGANPADFDVNVANVDG
jgi:predicted RNA-binding protein Jag